MFCKRSFKVFKLTRGQVDKATGKELFSVPLDLQSNGYVIQDL